MNGLTVFVERELVLAERCDNSSEAFHHLERAHILSQYSTRDHVRVHWAMLRWGLAERSTREVLGQILRVIAAATKTAIGWVPAGNTGGSNVSPIKPMPLPEDLAKLIDQHNS